LYLGKRPVSEEIVTSIPRYKAEYWIATIKAPLAEAGEVAGWQALWRLVVMAALP
jgi:hypothetical protein